MSKFWSKMAHRATPYVPGEQLNQTGVLKLNTNENPYPPSPRVIEAIQSATDDRLRLYPSPILEDLRTEIGAMHHLSKENVFVGNGSDEVLAFSFMAFFDAHQSIKFPEVTYSFYPVYANLYDIPFETVPMNDDLTIDPQTLYNSEGGVIFPNPNAPTSLYMNLEKIEEILKNNPNNVVIVDEAYIDFAPASAIELISTYDNLLVIQTMSKSRHLAGLRIGFALGHEDLIEGITRMKDSFNSYSVDRLAMSGALAAIKDQQYFEKTRNKIITTREWFQAEMSMLDFKVLPSDTNFVFVKHAQISASFIYERLRESKVLIRYFSHAPIDKYLRISIGTDAEMKQFISVLENILK